MLQYVQAYVMPKQTAVVIARTLWENFLVHYGWPEKNLMEEGKSFEKNLIQELCELVQVEKLCTSVTRQSVCIKFSCFV